MADFERGALDAMISFIEAQLPKDMKGLRIDNLIEFPSKQQMWLDCTVVHPTGKGRTSRAFEEAIANAGTSPYGKYRPVPMCLALREAARLKAETCS